MVTTREQREAAADAVRPHWRKNANNEQGFDIAHYVAHGEPHNLGYGDKAVDSLATLLAQREAAAVAAERDAWHEALCEVARQYEREAAYHDPNDAQELALMADAVTEAADRVLVTRTPLDELKKRMEGQGVDVEAFADRMRTKVETALRAWRTKTETVE